MEKTEFKNIMKEISYFISDLTEMELEDFIKQANYMLKNDKFGDEFQQETVISYLMVANGLLTLKSSLMMNINAFKIS